MQTDMIQQNLWRIYGSEEHPAEWDGNVFGGGKISQRYWEYFTAIEMLELQKDSIVLDIGGGKGFFAKVISPFVKRVIVLDRDQDPEIGSFSKNIVGIPHDAVGNVLPDLLVSEPVTHISCISVFEHVPDAVRESMISDVNRYFQGNIFVTTFEFHPLICYFEHQLTTRSMSRMLSNFTRYYPDRMEKSPLLSENALGKATTPFNSRKKQYIGMWYPIALRFKLISDQ